MKINGAALAIAMICYSFLNLLLAADLLSKDMPRDCFWIFLGAMGGLFSLFMWLAFKETK